MAVLPTIEPMKAVAGDLPADDDAWAYEIKWDGMRVVASLEDRGGPTPHHTTLPTWRSATPS